MKYERTEKWEILSPYEESEDLFNKEEEKVKESPGGGSVLVIFC